MSLIFLVHLVKSMKDLDLSLLKGFFLSLIFVFEFLNSVLFACFNMLALVDVTEATSTNKVAELVFIPDNQPVFIW